jgi:hypothetical protein
MRAKRDSIMNTNDYKSTLLQALGKLARSETQRQAYEEIKSLLKDQANTEDRILLFLNHLSENPTHSNILYKKELIKLHGVFAEVLEDKSLPYLPRLTGNLQKKLKEGDSSMAEVIASSYGMIVHNTLHTIADLPSSCQQLSGIIKPLFQNLGSGNKNLQVGAAQSLNKIVQHSPIECLQYLLDRITNQLMETLTNPACRTQNYLLETIISLILSVEAHFAPFVNSLMPVLLQCINNEDQIVRKEAVDTLYTLGAVVSQSVGPYVEEIMTILYRCRTDKAKPVRDSAAEALTLYKDIAPTPSEIPERKPAPVTPRSTASAGSKKEKPEKSIFKGPINPNFFKAAKKTKNPTIEVVDKGSVITIPNDSMQDEPDTFQDFAPPIQQTSYHADFKQSAPEDSIQPIVPALNLTFKPIQKEIIEAEDHVEPPKENPENHIESPWETSINQSLSPEPFRKAAEKPVTSSLSLQIKSSENLLLERVQQLERQNVELTQALSIVQATTSREIGSIHQRLTALEEMINTVAQLFDARMRQLLSNPKISELLK